MSPLFQTSWDRVGTADIDTDTELAGLLEIEDSKDKGDALLQWGGGAAC